MKMRLALAVLLGLGLSMSFGIRIGLAQDKKKQPQKTYSTIGKVLRFEKAVNKIVPKNSKIQKVGEGFVWTEGPCWVKKGKAGFLLFSDIPMNSVMQWRQSGKVNVFLKPSGYTGKEPRGGKDGKDEPGSNGLVLAPNGDLILCQHGDRSVARLAFKDIDRKTKEGKFQILAREYKGKRLNSPNDAVFHSNGDLYFTDPPYGLKKRYDDPARELDFCGVYRISKDGELTLLTKEMTRPNGIALSLDEKTLYVANSDPKLPIWKAFPVKKDGTLGKGKVLYNATKEMKAGRKGLPDGMTIDYKGNLFATGPGGVYVFTPKGKLLGRFQTGERTSNCTFGGKGGNWLYMTTDDYITRIRLRTKGKGFE
ncbi:MAG: SMP-30/gluconolactonase/LRE family protein [Gemmataceae bacterium]